MRGVLHGGMAVWSFHVSNRAMCSVSQHPWNAVAFLSAGQLAKIEALLPAERALSVAKNLSSSLSEVPSKAFLIRNQRRHRFL